MTAERRASDTSMASAKRRVPTAADFPDCRACQMWRDAGASWPRPCKEHYDGEPHRWVFGDIDPATGVNAIECERCGEPQPPEGVEGNLCTPPAP